MGPPMPPRLPPFAGACLVVLTHLGCAPKPLALTPEAHVAPSAPPDTPVASSVTTHVESLAEHPGALAGVTLGFATRWTSPELGTWRAGLELGARPGGPLFRGTLGWGGLLAESEGTTFSWWMSTQLGVHNRCLDSSDAEERDSLMARAALYGGLEVACSGESGALSLALAPGFGNDGVGVSGEGSDGLLSILGRASAGPEDVHFGLELGATLASGQRSQSSLLVGLFLAWSWGERAPSRTAPAPAERRETPALEPAPPSERIPPDERPRGRRREE